VAAGHAGAGAGFAAAGLRAVFPEADDLPVAEASEAAAVAVAEVAATSVVAVAVASEVVVAVAVWQTADLVSVLPVVGVEGLVTGPAEALPADLARAEVWAVGRASAEVSAVAPVLRGALVGGPGLEEASAVQAALVADLVWAEA
jgi:hypothetical protein